jgi:hypothetical protein
MKLLDGFRTVMHIVFFVSAIVLCGYGNSTLAVAQVSPSIRPLRTLEIADSVVRHATRLLTKQLRRPLFPSDTLLVHVKPHEGAWLLEQHLFTSGLPVKRFRPATYSFTDSLRRTTTQVVQLPAYSVLNVRFSELSVRYFATNDFASVAREVQCIVTGQLETNDGVLQVFESCTGQYQDTIPRTLVPVLESRQYSFTTAPLPDAMPNFWKQILEPTVIVITAVLVIAIFFFVRTQ